MGKLRIDQETPRYARSGNVFLNRTSRVYKVGEIVEVTGALILRLGGDAHIVLVLDDAGIILLDKLLGAENAAARLLHLVTSHRPKAEKVADAKKELTELLELWTGVTIDYFYTGDFEVARLQA